MSGHASFLRILKSKLLLIWVITILLRFEIFEFLNFNFKINKLKFKNPDYDFLLIQLISKKNTKIVFSKNNKS